jgi:hypothetical protein
MLEKLGLLVGIVAHGFLLWLAFRYYTGRVITVKDRLLSFTTLDCSAANVKDAAEVYRRLEPTSAEKALSLRKHIWVLLSDRRVDDVPYWIRKQVGLHKYKSSFTGTERPGDNRKFIVITCSSRRAHNYLLKKLEESNLDAVGSEQQS